MAEVESTRRILLLAASILLACGCENQDTERLGRAARRVASKFDSLTSGADDSSLSACRPSVPTWARCPWMRESPPASAGTRLWQAPKFR